jgi:hypothetical protein
MKGDGVLGADRGIWPCFRGLADWDSRQIVIQMTMHMFTPILCGSQLRCARAETDLAFSTPERVCAHRQSFEA